MGPSEDTGQDAAYAHDRHRTRHGRHGRPGPFGGRLRLPTLRFSGAAMAMSTVVGISIATTFLLNEQQGVGRRAGVARVGSSAPPPSPAKDPDTASGATSGPAAGTVSGTTAEREGTGPSAGRHPAAPTVGPRAPEGTPGAHPSTPAAPRAGASGAPSGAPLAEGAPARHGVTGEPAGQYPGGTGAGTPAGGRPTEEPTPTAQAPTTPGPSPSPTAPRPLIPAPGTPAPGTPAPPPREWTGETLGTPTDTVDQALTGAALVQSLGRDGTRHLLALTVTEPLTALQAEFRLAPGAVAPGTGTVWTDLAGVVVTTQHERGAAVYRFTTAPGTDVRPGQYTFAVRGTRPPAARPTAQGPSRPRNAEPRSADSRTAESWNASAFGIDRPRAVAALGGFGGFAPPTGTGPTAPAPRATVPAR
ncbi:hypothetical protein ACFP3U_25860 [Kitasatospora misakiensis]|uniref:Uncharacterized protein n=1 Tax=Kitasatospora misakiensis TaxID=67330 RepID=A0ABW0XBG8_9ACTN